MVSVFFYIQSVLFWPVHYIYFILLFLFDFVCVFGLFKLNMFEWCMWMDTNWMNKRNIFTHVSSLIYSFLQSYFTCFLSTFKHSTLGLMMRRRRRRIRKVKHTVVLAINKNSLNLHRIYGILIKITTEMKTWSHKSTTKTKQTSMRSKQNELRKRVRKKDVKTKLIDGR